MLFMWLRIAYIVLLIIGLKYALKHKDKLKMYLGRLFHRG